MSVGNREKRTLPFSSLSSRPIQPSCFLRLPSSPGRQIGSDDDDRFEGCSTNCTDRTARSDIPIGGQSLATGRSGRSDRQVPRSSFVSRVLDSRLHHEQVRGGHGRGRRGRSGGRGQPAQEEDEHDQERERNQALARLPEKLKRNNCLYNFNITQCIELFFFGKNLNWKSKAFQFRTFLAENRDLQKLDSKFSMTKSLFSHH